MNGLEAKNSSPICHGWYTQSELPTIRSTCPLTGFESSDASQTTAGAELPGFMPSNSV